MPIGIPNYPAALDTPVELVEVADDAITQLSAILAIGATEASVASTAGFSTTGILTIGDEKIGYTGITPTTFTGLARGVGGTTAAEHAAGTDVEILIVEEWHRAHTAAIIAIEQRLTAGDVDPNQIYAGPAAGGPAGPLFRSLAIGDVPAGIPYSKLDLTDSIVVDDINATGTPDATKYLSGDGSWSTPAGSGGSGTPAGGEGDVQLNVAGQFGVLSGLNVADGLLHSPVSMLLDAGGPADYFIEELTNGEFVTADDWVATPAWSWEDGHFVYTPPPTGGLESVTIIAPGSGYANGDLCDVIGGTGGQLIIQSVTGAVTLLGFNSRGAGYVVGDELYLQTGNNDFGIRVLSVGSIDAEILDYEIISGGSGYTCPSPYSTVYPFVGGSGDYATGYVVAGIGQPSLVAAAVGGSGYAPGSDCATVAVTGVGAGLVIHVASITVNEWLSQYGTMLPGVDYTVTVVATGSESALLAQLDGGGSGFIDTGAGGGSFVAQWVLDAAIKITLRALSNLPCVVERVSVGRQLPPVRSIHVGTIEGDDLGGVALSLKAGSGIGAGPGGNLILEAGTGGDSGTGGDLVVRGGPPGGAGAPGIVSVESPIVSIASITIPDDPYSAVGWDENFDVPTKNAVRGKIESMLVSTIVTVFAEGTSYLIDATLRGPYRVLINGGGSDCLLTNPTGLTDGQVLFFELIQPPAGLGTPHGIVLDTKYQLSDDIPEVVLSDAPDKVDLMTCIYNANVDRLRVAALTKGFANPMRFGDLARPADRPADT